MMKNSIILNNAYIGDNTVIENCIVESRGSIRANVKHITEPGQTPQIILDKNDRYAMI